MESFHLWQAVFRVLSVGLALEFLYKNLNASISVGSLRVLSVLGLLWAGP